jgi:hypothetical protein
MADDLSKYGLPRIKTYGSSFFLLKYTKIIQLCAGNTKGIIIYSGGMTCYGLNLVTRKVFIYEIRESARNQ